MENEMIQIGDEVIIISNCGGFLEPKSFREEFGEDSLNGIIIDIDFSRLNPYGVSFANGYSEIWLTLHDFEIKENKMLKFDANDIKSLEENTKQKLVLVENTYKGSLFKADIKNKTLNKSKLRIVKANN